MNVIELERALRQLRLGGMAAVLETRLRQAQAEPMAPIDVLPGIGRTYTPRRPTARTSPQTSRFPRSRSHAR
jgi:hypothetical protein